MKTADAGDDNFGEVIRLQLKKPKRWNWELTTSRSSPHIALPVIQLYNSKGKLLAEAKESGNERKSWHSAGNNRREISPVGQGHLQRCRSDILDRNKNLIALREQNSITRRSNPVERKLKGEYCVRRPDDLSENKCQTIQEIRPNVSDENRVVKKSKSAVLRFQDDTKSSCTPLKSSRECDRQTKYKRTKSDDFYKRLLKYSDESMKRAIADGYRNFITPQIETTKSETLPEKNYKKELGQSVSSPTKLEVKHVKHSKYVTRTCSAGTLVIKEETFNNPGRRRRRVTADCNAPIGGTASRPDNARKFPGNAALNGDPNIPRKDRRVSDDWIANRKDNKRKTTLETVCKPRECGLFYSKSDVFPFERLLNNSNEDKCDDEHDNYIVQEPSSGSRRTSDDVDKRERKKLRKVRRRYSEAPASSGTVELKPTTHEEKGNNIKARVVKEHKKDPVGDVELLRLVRQLSTDHVKMGANVSRHSSKGLSGRRSQSSGSICNGKGRHSGSEPKICGSLPSYLDERDGTGCNNNHHECEKPPLDEVERIPPLGDGAPLHWKFSDNHTTLCDQGYGSERSPEEEYPPPLPEHDNQCHHHLDLHSCYPFITPESTFSVSLAKGSRGLGLSVTGGVDSGGSWPGLIRIKRLFPHQPAAACGMLNVGDLILEANGITLTGLTNYDALEVLRTASNQVELKVCRPPPDVLSCVSPISEVPPPPPRREPPSSLSLPSGSDDEHCHGEFEVTMRKLQGSLGFTLRKEDDSALGHYIRALVREPALTDGRIRAGDKIIAVNDVEISPMSHEEAVQFLRQSGDIVKLRLYRDLAQTPVATLSPTETTPRTSFIKKAQLRQEAVDMLNDIAVRKLIPGNHDTYRRSLSPTSSPRRLRRPPCPSDASHITEPSRYLISDEQFHEGLIKKCSLPFDEDSFNSLFIEDDDCDRPSRPSSLDLYNPNQTPVAARKPKFNFSLAHNAYELNNLDAEILDAPNLTYNLGNDGVNSTEVECGDSFPQEPASMPHIPTNNPGFSYKNPAYQSAHPQCCVENGEDKHAKTAEDNNMKKWKGVVFSVDEERDREKKIKKDAYNEERSTVILSIELNRGWNSRLGFSLQGAAGVTYVSAVHADSVASRDGRIKPGDRLIKVNDESVENMSTNEIIDLLRIVRGPVCIVVSRTKLKEDCTKSNAVN